MVLQDQLQALVPSAGRSSDRLNFGGGSSSNGKKSGIGKFLIIGVVIVVVIILFVSCMSKSCSSKVSGTSSSHTSSNTSYYNSSSTSYTSLSNNYYSASDWESNSGVINDTVASGVPAKMTQILGSGKDVVTIMVYMCGTDLESSYGSATSDIQEMLAAEFGENVNLILFTGGASSWQNNVMSAKYNQIYQIKGGQLYSLDENAGTDSMTKESTLTDFIKYCGKNYKANRNILILWDHGSGSVEGYCYDEKHSTSGSLTLPKLKSAIGNSGVTFDFIGFDACLMATAETGLALSGFSDYMIASEETEDASGWYYTNWLTKLGSNTSISTIELGKIIADDFVSRTDNSYQGYGSTLSVTDLGELAYTVPAKLKAFATNVSKMIDSDGNSTYSDVSNARSKSREFGESYGIDQVDLVDFASRIATSEGDALATAVLGAIKYNKVTSNMSGSYGLSIYFPYCNAEYASEVEDIYEGIDLCDEYTDCVQKYASMGLSGQYASGGGSPFNSLYGLFSDGYGQNYDTSDYYSYGGNSYGSYDSIFGSSGNYSSYGGYNGYYDYDDYTGSSSSSEISSILGELVDSGLFDFGGRSFLSKLDTKKASKFISNNMFDQTALEWKTNKNGEQVISLEDNQWELVDHVLLNMYLDDGQGLIDLGTDNVFDFDDDGNMVGINDGTWLSIDGNIVAYYYESTIEGADGKGNFADDKYEITGYVPVLYNGKMAKMVLKFDSSNPGGYIAGLRIDYKSSGDETNQIPKCLSAFAEDSLASIKEGDEIQFVADCYDYDGNYQDSYVIESWTATKNPTIENLSLTSSGKPLAMYSFTDIYNQTYWTSAMK